MGALLVYCVTHTVNANTRGHDTNAFRFAAPSVALELEGVGEQVPYSPNLPEGGYASPQNRQRYLKKSVSINWPTNAGPMLRARIAEHSFNSLRDTIKANQFSIGISQQWYAQKLAQPITLDFSLQHSFTDQFDKNSYTHTSKGLIKSASIHRPKDIDAALALRYQFFSDKSISLFTSTTIGFSKTQFKSIIGDGVSTEGCALDFELLSNGGSITQSNVCGQVQSYQQSFPDDESLQARLGVRPRSEMQYQAWYLQQNLSANKTINRKTQVNVGYSARFYTRGKIDDTNFGYQHKPVTTSQTFTLGAHYQLRKRLILQFIASYRIAPFLDAVPFLYTRYTAHRYTGATPSFAIGARYHFY